MNYKSRYKSVIENNIFSKHNESTMGKRTNSINTSNIQIQSPKKPKQFTLKDLALYYSKLSFKDLFKQEFQPLY